VISAVTRRKFAANHHKGSRCMTPPAETRRSAVAESLYALLNPIPFGCFVAGLIFDIIYAKTAVILWNRGAAWLIFFGLLFAVVPRLINLARVWVTSRRTSTSTDTLDFWLNLLAIVAAIVNAFVHSRDAYAVVPTGVWLSAFTVILLSIANILIGIQRAARVGYVNE
jgi:uncharacterized membrane protein